MLGENEDVLIVKSQSSDAGKTARSNVLEAIKNGKNFQEAIKKLEKEKSIWYLNDPLHKDKNITEQINLKWEKEFQEFEQSIDSTHEELESSLPNQSFSAYSKKDNDFNIRFENKEEPIKISNILKASSEGKGYHISLGENSKITARRKKDNERHYNFAAPVHVR
ncbi:hypothetical protein [Wolbachia endosymbiont of Mansonella perstans]|uniref:hypothetical protein n=1 Tax=Wolbachia endosymbiont of Mansonella perstans TaxID=229526 RepID=UPI001CE037EA|nr:hypothetical protein [Wolbachia endosymbiont of Mansonella perstans]MCA4774138.1 hypothetical protein [Wolbachia endosymbiont of Mansonella perstans]